MLSLIRQAGLKRASRALQASLKRNFATGARGPNDDDSRAGSTSVDPKEVELFSTVKDWWDPKGSQRALHAYNYARVNYIKRIYDIHTQGQAKDKFSIFEGLDVLDVGCGAGIFCESAARLKGNVLGIDATPEVIKIAETHAQRDPALKDNLNYINTTAEDLVAQGKKFDIVTSLEVIEHVNDKKFFIEQLGHLTKDKGFLFISTINKTLLSYGVTILAAEVITRVVPRGTHDWEKFIAPEDLCQMISLAGLRVLNIQGFKYHPISNSMSETGDTSVNYIVACRKE